MRTKKYKKKHRKTKKGGVLENRTAVIEQYGTKGSPMNNLDLIFINIQKLLNQYSNKNNDNIRELQNNLNRSIALYLQKDEQDKKHIIDEIIKIENQYSTARK